MGNQRNVVRWSSVEWERLAVAAAPLVVEGYQPHEALRRVQQDVFRNETWRIREIRGNSDTKPFMPFLKDKVAALRLAHGDARPHPTRDVRPAPSGVARPTAPAAQEPPKPNGAMPSWMAQQVEKAAQEQAAKIRAQFDDEVKKRVAELLAPPADPIEKLGGEPMPERKDIVQAAPVLTEAVRDHQKARHDSTAPAEARKENPKVVIVGLWPRLRAEVNNEFKNTLDLRFFDNDKRDLAVIERHARSATLTITMEQIHGEVTNAARRAAQQAGKMWESVHGSKSAMFDRLTKLAVYRK